MPVQVSISRCQWPSVVRGAMTMWGPAMPRNWRWKASVAIDCAVLPSPCHTSPFSCINCRLLATKCARDLQDLHDGSSWYLGSTVCYSLLRSWTTTLHAWHAKKAPWSRLLFQQDLVPMVQLNRFADACTLLAKYIKCKRDIGRQSVHDFFIKNTFFSLDVHGHLDLGKEGM